MTTNGHALTLRCQFCDTWNRVDASRVGDRPKCGKCSRFLLIDRPWILRDDTFSRTVSESELPVLVDFYADWCGPCKSMAPAIDALAAKYHGSVLVAKLNTDQAPNVSQEYQIRTIPTLVVFRGGKEATRHSGAVTLPALEQLLKHASAA